MNNIIYNQNINNLVSKFENGKERFYKSATVNKVIQSLARDADPIAILDDLCKIIDDQNENMKKLVNEGMMYKYELNENYK